MTPPFSGMVCHP